MCVSFSSRGIDLLIRGVDFSEPYRLPQRSAALQPGQPFAGDDPHDVGEVLLALATPLFDGDEALARRLSYGALHKGPADAGAGRDLGDRPVTASSSPSECSAGALDRACGYRQFLQHAAMQPRTLAKVPSRIREEGAAP